MIIGVDNGNANTKTVHTVFTSGITEHDVKPPIGDELIKYKDKYYSDDIPGDYHIAYYGEIVNAYIVE